jgi:hypothetical protein
MDPGWKKFGSGINIPDPNHCFKIINKQLGILLKNKYGITYTSILKSA